MEVTRKNFKETLPLVADSIEKADFLVIDAEFTGLINGRDVSIFDSPEEYYFTLYNGASDFLLIQFGLCAFYYDENKKHYMNDAYNFFLFPRGRPGPERMFLCQSSSLDFLAAQGLDFNKVIKEGISYMSEPCETRLRENLTERQKSYGNDTRVNIPEENKQHIEDICKRVRQFLDEKTSDELEIDRCNAFIRLLLFQELRTKFKDEVFVETKVLENKNRVLKVTRVTEDNNGKNQEELKKEKEWEELEEAVGFSKVARMISQSEKLVVGHNMLLDLIHTLNHFFQPLPPDYNGFKEFVHCMFPKVLDTKYMSSLPPFKEKVTSNVLPHLLATLSEPPFSMPETSSVAGRGYSEADRKAHEAGFDAFVTGQCFLAMLAHLARMRGEPLGRAASHAAAIRPFLNKVFLAKTAHQNSPYMNLSGADPNPPRDHVFHLTFPKEWTRNDINQLFSPFGSVTVQFLDDTSAMVALGRRDQARDVQRALAKDARVQLMTYARYRGHKGQTPFKEKEQRKDQETYAPIQYAQTADCSPKTRLVNASNVKQKLPEKVERAEGPERGQGERRRANSVSSLPPARKRTSSGMFQVDDAVPPPKKIELTRSNSDSEQKQPDTTISNGRRKNDIDKKEKKREEEKTTENNKKTSHREKEPPGRVERFDAEAKTQCVSAFKESDSWD